MERLGERTSVVLYSATCTARECMSVYAAAATNELVT